MIVIWDDFLLIYLCGLVGIFWFLVWYFFDVDFFFEVIVVVGRFIDWCEVGCLSIVIWLFVFRSEWVFWFVYVGVNRDIVIIYLIGFFGFDDVNGVVFGDGLV